jgi:mono/diheme cytochrome c family protein
VLQATRNAALVAAFFFPTMAVCADPQTADHDRAARGRARYAQVCAQCHGHNMVNAGVVTYDLRRFPLDQRERFGNSVTNGKGNMPSFKGAMSEAEIDGLWAYVRTRGKQ